MNGISNSHELFGELIHSYTRAQAIKDGVLIDVSDTARHAGFRFPVAITAAAWADCVEWPQETAERKKGACQDEQGRLWDVVYMASLYARMAGNEARTMIELCRVPVHGTSVMPARVRLAMVIGPGDNGEPVITIMMPDED